MKTISLSIFASLALLFTLTSCNKDDDPIPDPVPAAGLHPSGARPGWGPTMGDSMLVVIEKLQSMGGSPIEALTPLEARQQPTLTNAVMAVMAEHDIPAPPSTVTVTHRQIPVTGGSVYGRIYTPPGNGPLPVILYYHGGGWVIADNDVYDASARGLADQTGAIVVSVDYRKGPEHKFPTAHNDAFEAYKWVLDNAASINANPLKVGVAGESAGGNLACNVSIKARDNGITVPLHQVLVYPVSDNDLNTESFNKYAQAKPLNKAMIPWFLQYYLNSMDEAADPRISLVDANLSNLPPTTIINAEIDPLRDDGLKLTNALQAAGVTVTRRLYDGVTHEFFGAAAVLPQAKSAQKLASDALKASFQ